MGSRVSSFIARGAKVVPIAGVENIWLCLRHFTENSGRPLFIEWPANCSWP